MKIGKLVTGLILLAMGIVATTQTVTTGSGQIIPMAVVGAPLIIISLCFICGGLKSAPKPAPAQVTIIQQQSPMKETIIKEVVREVVKIKCPYCGTLVDHTLSQCPSCSGRLG